MSVVAARRKYDFPGQRAGRYLGCFLLCVWGEGERTRDSDYPLLLRLCLCTPTLAALIESRIAIMVHIHWIDLHFFSQHGRKHLFQGDRRD